MSLESSPSKLIYCPHPFTNWSLNPKLKFNNELDHTKEGFRKTSEQNSIIDEFKQYNNKCDYVRFGFASKKKPVILQNMPNEDIAIFQLIKIKVKTIEIEINKFVRTIST